MLPKINPTTTAAWQDLIRHASEMNRVHMRDLFRDDPSRFDRFSLMLEELLFDYSKNLITPVTIELLLKLAEACKLEDAMRAMFRGDIINGTEKRAVLHTALRNFS